LLLTLWCGGAWAQSDAAPPASNATNATHSTTATAAPTTSPAPADWPEVKPGQSALEFVLEHAPAEVTLEQFLLALMQQNPKAFSGGNRQLSGLRLQLPTAEQAASVPADQARAQLLALRATIAIHESEGAQTAATSAAGAARAIPGMVWVVCVAALMVLAVLLFRRTRYEGRNRASAGGPKPQIPTTPATPITPTPPPEPQPVPPSRYRPALPPQSEPLAPQPAKPAAVDGTPAQPLLAHRPLSERADLPSLDLLSPTPDPSAPVAASPKAAPPEAAPPDSPAQAAPRTAAPARPLDFSGIDLDLGSAPRDKR
jgi:pilus assembly protein FimV